MPVGAWLLHDGANPSLCSMAKHRGIQLIIVSRSPEAAAELQYRYRCAPSLHCSVSILTLLN